MSKPPITSKAAAKPAPEKISPQEALTILETWLRERGVFPSPNTNECNDASHALMMLRSELETAARPVNAGRRDLERRVLYVIRDQVAPMEALLELLGHLPREGLVPAVKQQKVNEARQRFLRRAEVTRYGERPRLSPLCTIAVAHLFHVESGWLPQEGYETIADFMADVAATALYEQQAQQEQDDE